MPTVRVSALKCSRCGHVWLQRGADRPLLCPKCKSLRWDRPVNQKCSKCGREVEVLRPSGLCGFCDDEAQYAANREGDQDESP